MSIRIQVIISAFLISFLFLSCNEKAAENNDTPKKYQETGYPIVDGLTEKIFADPKNPDLLYQRSKAYVEIDAYDNAISDMYIAMKMDSLNPVYYTHLTDVFMNYYRSSQALETMRLAADRFPSNINILLNYAELCITLRQREKGLQTIQRILEQDNQNAQAYFLMGLLMKEGGDKNRAKGAFRQVVDIDPEVIDAYLLLSELHEEDDPKLAMQYINNALTISPQDVNALHSKAFFLQNNNRADEALEIYKQINTIASDYIPAFLNAGILLLEKEDYSAAFEQFNIIALQDQTSHIAYYYRGLANKGLGKMDLAKQDFQQSLNFKPEYKKALDELAKMK